jgi:hypothetical protein
MIEQKEKKFVDVVDLSEWEVLTDTGWTDIVRIGKTIPYSVWHLRAGEFFLECADEHIVYKDGFEETYVKDLVIGDRIICEGGIREVTECRDTGEEKPMWDLEVASEDHRYWTSGILSHNTLWMGNIAAKAMQSGNNVAVITLELSDRKYIKRMGANILNVRISEYGDFSENEEALKKRLGTFSFDTLRLPGKLIIKEFPTSQASAVDVENWLKRTEETLGIKFKVVIIDYINIMKNWRNPNSENTYMKIKQIAEDLRAAAQRNEWAIVTATQTKQCLTRDAMVDKRGDGLVSIFDITKGDEVLTHKGYVKVKAVSKIEPQKVIRIKTKSGKTITASYSHRFPVSSNSTLTEAKDLKIGDKLLVQND